MFIWISSLFVLMMTSCGLLSGSGKDEPGFAQGLSYREVLGFTSPPLIFVSLFMPSTTDFVFKIIFDTAAEPKVLVSNELPGFSILFANKAFASFIGKEAGELWKQSLPEVFSHDEVPNTKTIIQNSLLRAVQEERNLTLPLFLYPAANYEGELPWWKAKAEWLRDEVGNSHWLVFTIVDNVTLYNQSNAALLKKQGQLTGELKDAQAKLTQSKADLKTSDDALTKSRADLKISDNALSQSRFDLRTSDESLTQSRADLAAANEEIRENNVRLKDASESDYRLSRIVSTTPVGLTIFKGRQLIIEVANEAILTIWGRTLSQVIGKPLLEVFPELLGQPFPGYLYSVLDTGITISISDEPVTVALPDGTLKNLYVNFSYDALYDTEGKPDAVLVSVKDVTDIVEARLLVQSQRDELEAVNKEMTATNEEMYALNEELTASNEEIRSTNEELELSKQELETVYEQLVKSENIFRGIFDQSPLAIALLKGNNLLVEEANENILKLWGRSREEVQGLPLRAARPELEGQLFINYLYEAYQTGRTFRYGEQKGTVLRNGKPYEGFFSGVYQPIKDEDGKTTGLIVIIEEVTEEVMNRRRMETLREEYDQAISTANLAPWSIDMRTKHLYVSKELRELLGLPAEGEVIVEDALPAVDDIYKAQVLDILGKGITEYQPCDFELPITNLKTLQKLWVRITGKVFFNADGTPSQFAGVYMDITERKKDDQRKNDFIGMVSHELKTPLTSLSGYLQLLQTGAGGKASEFQAMMLDKAGRQISRMTKMINSFLNISRLEAGKIQIDKTRFDMALLMKEEEEETRATYTSHTFIFEPVETTITDADRDKILQVVNNFISNAVKYSPAGTTIQIACMTVNGMAQVSVKDNGNGIPAEDSEKIFDRYYRVKDGSHTPVAGFGIGLYLCYEIVQRHNGRIWLQSEPGKGSTFYFTLPLAEVSGPVFS